MSGFSYQGDNRSKHIEPIKLTHCKHSAGNETDVAKLIYAALTATHHYNNWTPLLQFEYHSVREQTRKNNNILYSNFYFDEYEEEETRPPEDPFEFYNIMCKNCWINLLPKMYTILSHIVSSQNKMLSKPQVYIQSYDAWIHFIFMKHVLVQINIIQYILKHSSLYKLFFDYLINMIQFVHIKSNLHLFIQTLESIKNPTPDILDPACKHTFIYIPQLVEQQEGSYLSSCIVDEFQFGKGYIYTTRYWTQKHFKYVFKHKQILSLIQNDFIQTCLNRCSDLHLFERSSFKTDYVSGGIMGQAVLWTLVFEEFLEKNKKYQNKYKSYSISNDKLLEKICTFLSYRHFREKYKYANHNTLMKIINEIFTQPNVKNICNSIANAIKIVPCRESMKAMLSKDKNEIRLVFDKWITQAGKEKFLPNKLCCSPCCNYSNWKQLYSGNYDLKTEFVKIKFHKCGKCKVARYCSRYCQKVHWNLYGHKKQCRLFCNAF